MVTNKITTITAIFLVLALSITLTSALTIQNVETIPAQVEPGQKVEIKLEIKNNLADDVTDVEIGLQLNAQTIQSLTGTSVIPGVPLSPVESSEVYIDEIQEDDKENVKFELIADADSEAGVYKIPVVMSYLVNGGTQRTEKQFTISVTINSAPNLVLNSEGLLLKNQKNKVEILITNIGLNKAKLLEVSLVPSSDYQILSASRIYIGDLDSDDFDVASFEVFMKDKSSVTIPVTLRYRDALNKQYTEQDVVLVRVYSTDEAVELGLIQKNNTMIYAGVVVALVLIWFVWRKWRKKRKKKRAEGVV